MQTAMILTTSKGGAWFLPALFGRCRRSTPEPGMYGNVGDRLSIRAGRLHRDAERVYTGVGRVEERATFARGAGHAQGRNPILGSRAGAGPPRPVASLRRSRSGAHHAD